MTSLLFFIKLLTQKFNSYKACCPGKFTEILLQKAKQIYLLLLDSRKEPLLKKQYSIWNGNNSAKRKDENSWGGDHSPKKILATNHNGHHYLLSHKKIFTEYLSFVLCCESVSLSVVSNSLRPHGLYQAPLSMEFSRQEYWSGLPFPSPRNLPGPGVKPVPPALRGGFFTTEPPGKPQNKEIPLTERKKKKSFPTFKIKRFSYCRN